MRFQVGDTVRIASDCQYLSYGHADNPKDTDGTIREIEHNDVIVVDWDNGNMNEYDERDLRLRSRPAQTIPEYNPREETRIADGYADAMADWGLVSTGDSIWR